MTIYFTRLRVGYPDPLKHPPDQPGSWRVFVMCNGPSEAHNTTRKDVNACESASDKAAMRNAFIAILAKAVTGLPFDALWDDKQCHEAHTFIRNHQEEKIFRIRSGPIRVYFIYLPEKIILIVKSKAKRTDKLSGGEKKELADIVESVLDTLDLSSFNSKVI
jgi:hypothetical protein